MNLYIYNYNNYYNRIVKKAGDHVNDYNQYKVYGPVQGVYGFTPGDGVNTTQIIGTAVQPFYDGKGDYLIAADEYGDIISRWFIIDHNRTRDGQWSLVLHRDLIVDYQESVMSSPMYVEKATVNDDDPAIYNSESVRVNQIKTNEYVLKDDSRCAWLVGYVDRKYSGESFEFTAEIRPEIEVESLQAWDYYDFWVEGGNKKINKWVKDGVYVYFDYLVGAKTVDKAYDDWVYRAKLKSGKTTWTSENIYKNEYTGSYWVGSLQAREGVNWPLSQLNNAPLASKSILNYAETYLETFEDSDLPIESLNNKYIKDLSTNRVYKIQARRTFLEKRYVNVDNKYNIDGIPAIADYVRSFIPTTEHDSTLTGAQGRASINIASQYMSYDILLEEMSTGTYTVDMPSSASRYNLTDAPYDMFCIPYNAENPITINYNQKDIVIPSGLVSLSCVQSIAQKMASNLFDVQLLPYCPLQGYTYDANTGKLIFNDVSSKFITTIKDKATDVEKCVLFWASTSQGTINDSQLHLINTENDEELSLPIVIQNKKLSNECDMYRLCSPNYNGQFEFNAAKLDGITGFNVDYTYLPYSPYIHVNPNFSGLYGKDFDDARGLICQGDFSISYLSSKWEEYQVQNKNYANIFNRGTQNLELTQKVERTQQIFNAVTGTISGGVSGGVTGASGGIYGAIAGAAVGTLAGGIGGALDVQYGDLLRNEALDYRKDLYNYNLENIQALPDSIAKVTAYTKNNKVFPILEYYTCTDVEKKAVANKIAYNGMTVMRIGSINEFINNQWSYGDITSKNYIKGQLIRLEGAQEDYHIVNSLAGELVKGVFIE